MQATVARSATAPVTKTPSVALRRFAWLLLAYNVFVILWGAVVRATSSGDGCGSHWPLCNGTILQHHPRAATLIELAHRMSSGLVLIGVVILVIWTFRRTPRGAWARVTAAAATLLTLNEAFLGAMLVKLGYVDQNASVGRSIFLAMHLTNTLLMLAAVALSAHFLSNAASRFETRITHAGAALPGLLATLIVCVSGSLAALSDTLYPAQTLASALLQDFAPHTNLLIRLRILHPLSALIATVFIAWLAFRAVTATDTRQQRPLAFAVVLLLGFQILIGLGRCNFVSAGLAASPALVRRRPALDYDGDFVRAALPAARYSRLRHSPARDKSHNSESSSRPECSGVEGPAFSQYSKASQGTAVSGIFLPPITESLHPLAGLSTATRMNHP